MDLMYCNFNNKSRSDDIYFMSLSRATPMTRLITSQDVTAYKQREEKKINIPCLTLLHVFATYCFLSWGYINEMLDEI